MKNTDHQYQGQYTGRLKTYVLHRSSGDVVRTDAPKDNRGDGRHFSPTDLAATALGTCMLTIMGIKADAERINVDGATFYVRKTMSSDRPRRIVTLDVDIHMPDLEYTTTERQVLYIAAANCPVAKSLHPDIEQRLTMHWSDGSMTSSVDQDR